MGEILTVIRAAAGLVTLGTFLRYLARRNDPDDDVPGDGGPFSQILREHLIKDFLELQDLSSAECREIIENPHVTTYGEFRDRLLTVQRSRRRSAPSTADRLRILGRHLPKELQPHRQELLQFLEDGLADLGAKKRKRFLFTQYFSLAIYIGKARLFKLSKSWRRTIR